jgi:hypothetical protein
MDICKIEGFTRVLGAPQDWDQSKVECQGLPIFDTEDGWMVSQWKPNELEIETLRHGGSLMLWVFGTAHPVVGLDVSAADGVMVSYDAPQTIQQELAHRNAEVKLLRLALARLGKTLGDQQRICDIALASTGGQPDAADL